jgi:hypothetical protein
MTRMQAIQTIAMSALSMLGIIGVIATNRLLAFDMSHGLVSWQDDRLFLVTAYGLSIFVALIGALRTAYLLRRHQF